MQDRDKETQRQLGAGTPPVRTMRASALMLALAGAFDPAGATPAAGAPPEEEIVVTGERGRAEQRSEPDAVEILRAFCFDPARRMRRFDPPAADSRWFELDERERRQFKIDDPAVPAFALHDEARGHQLWVKFEHFTRPERLDEKRCTLLVIGGRDHDRFVAQMNRLFRGTPTQRHVGHRHGAPSLPGWRQWLWTGMPASGSSSWRSIEHPRGSSPSWLVVSSVAGFYRSYDYILGDMKLREGPGPAMTMLSFSHTTRRAP